MRTDRAPARRESLAAAHSGERFTIARILGDGISDACAGLGLHAGDAARCRAATRYHIWIEAPGGGVVALERDLARYVEVSLDGCG